MRREKRTRTEVFNMQALQEPPQDFGTLYRTAERMASRFGTIGIHEPADIAQDVMIKVIKKSDGRGANNCWLRKAVQTTAIDAGRAFIREAHLIDHGAEVSADGNICVPTDTPTPLYIGPAEHANHDEVEIDLIPRLKTVLDQLTKPLRQTLVLHAEGYSYEEIGRIMECNVGTVRSRLHYSRLRARELWGPRE